MKIITLDQAAVTAHCLQLLEMARADGFPADAVVGVKTGGWLVAQTLQTSRPEMPLAHLKCQRPLTKTKKTLGLKRILSKMPYIITDTLRRIEHNRLEARAQQLTSKVKRVVTDDTVSNLLPDMPKNRPFRVLVIDDAVDSGGTLVTVADHLEQLLPAGTDVRFATITTTFSTPQRRPNYTIYDTVLCRFYWSDDFRRPSHTL